MGETSRIVITGASGFLGRYLVRLLCRRHKVVAIDRRPRAEAQEAGHPSVEWHQIDLSDRSAVDESFACINAGGRVDVLIHLAAYYDFTGEEDPEYKRSNIDALRLLLESARGLELGRFVFTSSIAACPTVSQGAPITEATPPDGEHIYARTKKVGEQMLAEFGEHFPSVIIRFAAMFSDWCEYPPLQAFLETWLSRRWNSHIIGGRGDSAIPYLHIRDATHFMSRVLERIDSFEAGEILIAGNDGALSHKELFDAATAFYFGAKRRSIHVPRALCRPGIWARDLAGRMTGSRPFERPWMAAYVDKRYDIDASRSRRRVGWAPNPRRGLLSRLPFLIENYKTSPLEWYRRNQEALEHVSLHPSFRVYRLLKKYEAEIERELVKNSIPSGATDHVWDTRLTLGTLISSVRSGERESFSSYCQDLAQRLAARGVPSSHLVQALRNLEATSLDILHNDPESAAVYRPMRDYISMTVEFGIDRVLEAYEDAAAFGGDPDAR